MKKRNKSSAVISFTVPAWQGDVTDDQFAILQFVDYPLWVLNGRLQKANPPEPEFAACIEDVMNNSIRLKFSEGVDWNGEGQIIGSRQDELRRLATSLLRLNELHEKSAHQLPSLRPAMALMARLLQSMGLDMDISPVGKLLDEPAPVRGLLPAANAKRLKLGPGSA